MKHLVLITALLSSGAMANEAEIERLGKQASICALSIANGTTKVEKSRYSTVVHSDTGDCKQYTKLKNKLNNAAFKLKPKEKKVLRTLIQSKTIVVDSVLYKLPINK